MKTRTAGAVVGILAVVCIGLVFSVVYPFTTAEPHAANPTGERFTIGDTDAYSATGKVVVDGDVQVAFEGVVTADGAWYQKVVQEGVTSEEYRPSPNGTVYQRLTIDGRDDAEQRREQIVDDDRRTLVRETQNGDTVTFVVEKNASSDGEPVSGTASVVLNSLSIAGYEHDESDSSPVTVYEPQAGWYDERKSYRITDASGAVRANSETGAVNSANVSWALTTPAGTYAEYALVTLTDDDPTTHRFSFELDTDDADLEEPPWVSDLTG
ncbi:hypothetical protein [Haloarchaeobius sp. DFWS5]|uniref:hypothetical protein n=1 Tax=Haloarchaeobius sp. DFWS5 TaxID=3446114 RepID=UPI003EBCB3B3